MQRTCAATIYILRILPESYRSPEDARKSFLFKSLVAEVTIFPKPLIGSGETASPFYLSTCCTIQLVSLAIVCLTSAADAKAKPRLDVDLTNNSSPSPAVCSRLVFLQKAHLWSWTCAVKHLLSEEITQFQQPSAVSTCVVCF